MGKVWDRGPGHLHTNQHPWDLDLIGHYAARVSAFLILEVVPGGFSSVLLKSLLYPIPGPIPVPPTHKDSWFLFGFLVSLFSSSLNFPVLVDVCWI